MIYPINKKNWYVNPSGGWLRGQHDVYGEANHWLLRSTHAKSSKSRKKKQHFDTANSPKKYGNSKHAITKNMIAASVDV
jgi:hypothetical protein